MGQAFCITTILSTRGSFAKTILKAKEGKKVKATSMTGLLKRATKAMESFCGILEKKIKQSMREDSKMKNFMEEEHCKTI